MRIRAVRSIKLLVVAAVLAGSESAAAALSDLAVLDRSADAGEMQERIAALDRQIRDMPREAALYVRRGHARFRLRDFDGAIEDYSAALEIDGKQDEAWFGRGMAHGRAGAIPRGIADLTVYLERHPTSSLAHTKRGIRHLWNGDAASAERDFTRAIELDPKNAEANDDLGVIKARRGDYEGAARHFAATLKLDPSYQKAWHNLAMTRFLLGLETQALSTVNEALRLSPENRNSLLLKAEILEALGRLGEAKAVRADAEFLPEGNWSEQLPVR